MNILMALSQLEVTGAEVYAAQLADALVERGHRVFILSDTFTKSTKAVFTPLPFNERSWRARWRNVRRMVAFIRQHKIHVVHAHSRASGWVAFFAAKIARVPLVTTVHGRQPTHFSRKLIRAFGELALPICEAVRDNIVDELGVHPERVRLVRNGVDAPRLAHLPNEAHTPLTITLVGRLSKEKGELAYRILTALVPLLQRRNDVVMQVVGGKEIPPALQALQAQAPTKIAFTGYVEDVTAHIARSTLLIGAGRSAIEGMLLGKPVIAVGEARLHGLVRVDNLAEVLRTNFGDIDTAPHQYDNAARFNWAQFAEDVEKNIEAALQLPTGTGESAAVRLSVQARIRAEFAPAQLVERVESAYQTALVLKHRFEVPILTYHRVVRTAAEGGKLPIYVTAQQMETHLQCLKEQGFQTITFRQLAALPPAERVLHFLQGRKYALLTFDDGYEDNYTLLFPLLKKYGMTATIFCVAGRMQNDWDSAERSGLAPVPLMNAAQMLEMQDYGIEFGAHTMTHPHLTQRAHDEARWEIAESKRVLESRLGREVQAFCYPYGDYNDKIMELVREAGYTFGVASDAGPLCLHEDVWQVRRIGVFPNTNKRGFLRKIKGDYLLKKHGQ
jgi:peptidoglycan/xylan/chitin deacetylase (PgdA/CDA1 family)/glycosyltransferase involved in cell wall biosynthesis